MFTIHESEKSYRHEDHGPKYLEKGPRMNFGIVRILPHSEVSPHVHEHMQEGFYIMEGNPTFYTAKDVDHLSPETIDSYTAKQGDYIHIEPGEPHKVINHEDFVVKMVVTAAPFVKDDKITIDM